MIFKRDAYGIEEIVVADEKSKNIQYKVKTSKSRFSRYVVDIIDGIPYIKRYGKKVSLEGFYSEDEKLNGRSLASYISGISANKKTALFSFMDYQQFIYINTICKEEVVKEIILLAKNVSKSISKTQGKPVSVFDIINTNFNKIDRKSVVINGFNAKRIR